ncbi:ankyrin repeat-containing domain protein [Xylaria cf. heliscus]|nr:ankyrin repeat-containing domain protein [Xylaria cf. heliscus]
MASLGNLPVETAFQVLQDLGTRDLAAIAATCRGYYILANPLLYRKEVENSKSYTFYDAAASGNIGRLQRLIDAGFDVNQIWFCPFKGPRFEDIKIMDRWRKGSCAKSEVIQHRKVASERQEKEANTRYYQSARYISSQETDEETDDSDGSEADDSDDSETADSNLEKEKTNSWSPNFLGATRGLVDVDLAYYWTALHLAVANGRHDTVSFLINKGAEIDSPSKGFCECRQVKAYVNYNADTTNLPVWSPLHVAICRGNLKIARLLLAHGASVVVEIDGYVESMGVFDGASADFSEGTDEAYWEIRGRYRCTALHLACYHGAHTLVKSLIQDGYQSDLEAKDGLGQTPLAYAFLAGQFDCIIPYLQSKGGDINTIPWPSASICSGSLLLIACHAYQYPDALRLIELGADVNSVDQRSKDSLLHICTKLTTFRNQITNYEFARKLLEVGAGPSLALVNERGCTPLISAIDCLDVELIKLYIQYGADVSARDINGNTMLACFCKHQPMFMPGETVEELVSLLTPPSVDPNARNAQNRNALHVLCDRTVPRRRDDMAAFIKIIIRHGVDVTVRDESGLLPFHNAFREGWSEACPVLLNEEVKRLLTKEDITDMFNRLVETRKPYAKEELCELFQLLLDVGDRFISSEPNLLALAHASRKKLFPTVHCSYYFDLIKLPALSSS